MATFGDIIGSVSRRLIDPQQTAVSRSDVAAAINDAVSYWKNNRFWFNELIFTDTVLQHTGTIPLPSDFLVPSKDDGAFDIEYSQLRYPLLKTSQQIYDNRYLANGYGLPRYYARLASQEYQVYPLANIDYTIRGYYLPDFPDLVADTDTNLFTINAPRLLTLWATADLMEELRQDNETSDYFRTRAQREAQNMFDLTREKNATGSLTLYSEL